MLIAQGRRLVAEIACRAPTSKKRKRNNHKRCDRALPSREGRTLSKLWLRGCTPVSPQELRNGLVEEGGESRIKNTWRHNAKDAGEPRIRVRASEDAFSQTLAFGVH